MKEMTCRFLRPFLNLKEQKTNLLSRHLEFWLSMNEALKKSLLIAQPLLLRLEAEFQCSIHAKKKMFNYTRVYSLFS